MDDDKIFHLVACMQLSWQIAWRYLVGRKSTNAIQIITRISVLGLAFGTAAIVLILSVFNGFEVLLLSMYQHYNPDISIMPAKGKTFSDDSELKEAILNIEGIALLSDQLDELALFEYGDRQEVGHLVGIDSFFLQVTGMDSMIRQGSFKVHDDQVRYGVFGAGMAYKLGLNVYDRLADVSVYMLDVTKSSALSQPFNRSVLYPGGTFAVQHEIDYDHVLTDLDLVQRLTSKHGQLSSWLIKLENGADIHTVKAQLNRLLGPDYVIADRMEQQDTTIKVMRIEKWLSFLILILVLVLVAVNLIGAIWMIVMDKRTDISVLSAMGASNALIRRIIIRMGVLICSIGFGAGLMLAILVYTVHKQFGLFKMGDLSLVEEYPMELYLSDLPIVALVVLILGTIAVLIPARAVNKGGLISLKHNSP